MPICWLNAATDCEVQMAIRKFIREKLPFLRNVYASIRAKQENCRITEINEAYRRAIEPLMDPEVLDRKMTELDEKCADGDKTYYIIAQQNTKVGIYGYMSCFLPHIAYAVAKGYIPVIDMRTYGNIYVPKDSFGTQNAWELFFEQPMGKGLDDLSDGKVIRCPDELWYRWMPNTCPMMPDAALAMWAALYKKYIRHNAKAEAYIRDEMNRILVNSDRTVGVIYRGTTYTKGQATGHPIQPTMTMLADAVDKMMADHDLEYIYLASDEKSIVDYMNSRFPGKVRINKRVYYDEVNGVDYSRYNVDGTDIVGNMFDRENNEYLIGIEYISSMNLVAGCGYLIAGACGGCTAALYMNGLNYRERLVFELGKYGIDPVPTDEEE